jgi:uncharacterized membrane protein YeaQ/YmgE (transglycosylase-associated protein family)
MTPKQFIWLGLIIGSTIGGFVPELWGAGVFSFSSMLLSTVGAVVGIIVAFKLTR